MAFKKNNGNDHDCDCGCEDCDGCCDECDCDCCCPMKGCDPAAVQITPSAPDAVIVRTGDRKTPRPAGITGAFPATIMTVIVSPIARPTPSITAVKIPERAAGTVTRQIVCHSVAPSASAASR